MWTIGIEAGSGKSLYSVDMLTDIAIVVGSEGSGIRRLVREKCDITAQIPMKGTLNSLNAAQAGVVALFEAGRQRGSREGPYGRTYPRGKGRGRRRHSSHPPLVYSTSFSFLFGADIYLKLENLQKTGSFKPRGAYNKIRSLTNEEKKRGVIAASSGNHAQGVAWAASFAGIKSTIVMPETAPITKRVATVGYGASVVSHGSSFDEACARAIEIARKKGLTFIHPFDDELVMAGQGTIGLEILEAPARRLDNYRSCRRRRAYIRHSDCC